jgi:tRNA U34 5-methylaminomethyl-2-thiouridine-forming methyltransferase MnmC
MPASPEIFVTKDGSHSLLNVQLNETYHSVHGALQESRYVFIEQGLKYWLARSQASPNILEVGFGTGLNALLALEYALNTGRPIQYVSLETFPLPEEVWSRLNYSDQILSVTHYRKLHAVSWGEEHLLAPEFYLRKVHTSLQDFESSTKSFDLIFFDAFAPSKQPEMWQESVLAKVVSMLRPAGVFVTYCAKGQLKRDLKNLNMVVETLPGPPGKKEMVRAVCPF